MKANFSLQSELGRAFWDLLHLAVLRPFVLAIVARVPPWASKGHDDLTSSPPSSSLRGSLIRVPGITRWQLMIRVALVMGLNPTSHDTSRRQPCSTCHGYGLVTVRTPFRDTTSVISNPGKVLRVASN